MSTLTWSGFQLSASPVELVGAAPTPAVLGTSRKYLKFEDCVVCVSMQWECK